MSFTTLGLMMCILAVNSVHLLLYLNLKKQPLSILTGALLLALPWLIVHALTGTPSTMVYGRPSVMVLYLLYGSWIFDKFIADASLKKVVFTVFFIISYGQITFLTIYTIAVEFLGYLPNAATSSACRYVSCLLTVLLFPLIYRYFRPVFRRILESVELQKLSVVAVFQICIFLLGYATATMAFFYHGEYVVFAVFATVFAEVAFYFVLYNFIVRESENQVLQNRVAASEQLVKTYDFYKAELEEKESKIRVLRHDFRHLLGHLGALAKEGDTVGIASYIATVTTAADDIKLRVYCENKAVNSIISFYFSRAEQNGTACSAQIFVPASISLSEADLAVILGNALENCMKGAAPLAELGYIEVRAKPVNDCLVFKFTNNHNGTYSKGAGIGLTSIARLCEQYQGHLNVSDRDGTFELTVVVKLFG